jgi:hypothetical protein
MPSARRTNNSSDKAFLSLRSAWLTADCETLNRSLAAAIECASKTALNTVNKLRSKFRICMVFTFLLNKLQDDYESLRAQYDPSSGSRVLVFSMRELDAPNFLKDRGEPFVRVAVLNGLGSRSSGKNTARRPHY